MHCKERLKFKEGLNPFATGDTIVEDLNMLHHVAQGRDFFKIF